MDVSFAELRLMDWQRGRAGSFVNALFECMCTADEANLTRMGEGFPEEVRVFKKFRHQPGYYESLRLRCELPLSGD
jgi:hypothetical protein